jgi:hypothetical protein
VVTSVVRWLLFISGFWLGSIAAGYAVGFISGAAWVIVR